MARPAARIEDPTARLRADAAALHAALSDLVRIYQYRDRERICCHDISVTQCHALEALIEQGPQRSLELAQALRLDKSTTTRVVDALVRKGYAERRDDPADARAVQLRVTAEGRRLHARIRDEMVAQQAALLDDLTPEQRRLATDVVRRLVRSAESRFAPACAPAACAPAGCAPRGCAPDHRA